MEVNTVVRLKVDLPKHGLSMGAVGAIVAVFNTPEEAYEVEFVDDAGQTVAQVALTSDAIEAIG